ncbi:MAG: hypothetical protein Q7U45_13925, partial [Burkholderiaceae bacterium]|nr:hypothetical protein [Burkholderiaceae bacterium]
MALPSPSALANADTAMPVLHGPFAETAALLLLCAAVGALFVRLRQPVLIAYIVVGILVGPAVLGLV